jgi:hypothetical protein
VNINIVSKRVQGNLSTKIRAHFFFAVKREFWYQERLETVRN